MNNIEHIKYTYKHRKIVMLLAQKYFSDNLELLEQIKYHDLDKLFMYLFYNKSDVSKIHRTLVAHHENEIEKTNLDYIEMVLDWESARYTKPDKPLNAYDTLCNYYPNMKDKILPILKTIGLDKPNLPMEKDILDFTNSLNNVSLEELTEELKKYINLLTNTTPKNKIKQKI